MGGPTTSGRLLPSALLLVAALSVAPFLRFLAGNLHEDVSAIEVSAYALAFAAATSLAYGIVHVVLRPRTTRPAAVFAALLFSCVSYYGVASELAGLGAGYALQNAGWGLLLGGSVALCWWLGARRNFWLFLQCFAAIGLALPAFTLLRFDRPSTGPGLPLAEAYPLAGNDIWSGDAGIRPNVYWLVLDSYPNQTILRSHYQFDGTAFVEALEARGFYVAVDSFANFSSTTLSVPTALNMEYVLNEGERYTQERGGVHVALPGNTNSGMMAAVAGDNRSVSFFRQLGYRYVHYEGKSFHLTRCRGSEDLCIRGAGLSELQLQLLSLLPIRPLLGWMSGREPALTLRRSSSASGTGLPELGSALRELNELSPFFLYAHLSSPHPPFYNRANCKRARDASSLSAKRFVAQLRCVNRQLIRLLDQIARDDPDAIVLVSSDHGPRLSVKTNLSTHELQPAQILENLAILNAFKLPEACNASLTPRMSPVNSMRVVFACLGGHAPRLVEDVHFVARRTADRGVIRRVEID